MVFNLGEWKKQESQMFVERSLSPGSNSVLQFISFKPQQQIGATVSTLGFLDGAGGKESTCQCRTHRTRRFSPWVRKVPWRRKRQPTPVFLPGKSHGWRSLEAHSPRRPKESDTTEATSLSLSFTPALQADSLTSELSGKPC